MARSNWTSSRGYDMTDIVPFALLPAPASLLLQQISIPARKQPNSISAHALRILLA
jgi:hypothetical protein